MNFETLFTKISPRLKKIARRYNGYIRCINEDDLYQEMCAYVWNLFKDGVPQDLNDTYIVKGCEFYILNFLRKNKIKVKTVSLEEPLTENGNKLRDILPDEREPLDKTVDKKIIINHIKNDGLTPRQKEIFLLLSRGYTVREIGKFLGISHVAVLKHKRYLIEKCSRKLQ